MLKFIFFYSDPTQHKNWVDFFNKLQWEHEVEFGKLIVLGRAFAEIEKVIEHFSNLQLKILLWNVNDGELRFMAVP